MPVVSEDHGLSALVASDEAEQVVSGCQFTEGPIWLPEGALLFSDIPRNQIRRWSPGAGATTWREPSGNSNGLTLDAAGRLLACEHGNRRVSRTTADGGTETLADRFRGRRLNSPNDLVVHSSGAVYFTDPPYGVKPADRELDFQGVYRWTEQGGLELLVADFNKPNGLAFSPDESVLYVDDTDEQQIRAFTVAADGQLTDGRVFARMTGRGADGLKVDVDGRVYCTGPGGCWVFTPDGAYLGKLTMGEQPANVAWGDEDRQTLYLTARTSVYRIRMKVRGLAPA